MALSGGLVVKRRAPFTIAASDCRPIANPDCPISSSSDPGHKISCFSLSPRSAFPNLFRIRCRPGSPQMSLRPNPDTPPDRPQTQSPWSFFRRRCNSSRHQWLFFLAVEYPEIISAKRLGPGAGILTQAALASRIRYQRANRARRLIALRRPIQPVVFSCVAYKLRGIFVVTVFGEIFFLRGDHFLANAYRRKFVFADPPEQNFLSPGLRIEIPLARAIDERNRRRPVFRADVPRGGAVGFFHQPVHHLKFLDKILARSRVFLGIAGLNDRFPVRPQHLEHRLLIIFLRRRE